MRPPRLRLPFAPRRSGPAKRTATLLFALAVGGCSSGATTPMDASAPPDLAPPPMICKTPPPSPASPWFEDVTDAMLTTPNPKLMTYGTSIHAGDLDNDGYPDLVTSSGSGTRDTPTALTRFVWMNRPDPSDPTGKRRIFVDNTIASNLTATPDGKGGYAFGVASLGDVDNNGTLDVVVGPSGDNTDDDPGAVMLNDGTGHFKLAKSSDINAEVRGFAPTSAVLLDFDKDGLLDYMPATFNYPPPNMNPPILLKGSGDGRFTDVTMMWGINTVFGDFKTNTELSPMYGITACDLDMDGDPDLLFSSYGREPNLIYINQGDHFTEMGQQLGLAYDDRMDFSDDQSYRCFCMNNPAPGTCNPMPPPPVDVSICTGFGIPNAVDGRGWIPGQSDQFWSLGGNNYSFACADFDNDGDMDLMTGTIRHGDVGSSSDPSEIVVNGTPPGMPLMKFTRPGNAATGLNTRPENGIYWNEGDLTSSWADLDNDGLKDIYLCSSDYPSDHGWVWHQKPDHTFEDVTNPSALGQKEAAGIAFADIDRDGDIDVIIGTSVARNGAPTEQMHIYRNLIGQASNSLQVQLVGKGKGGTNRSAIGALVKVTAGGVTQMQEISGGYANTATQSEQVLTFGLGATCIIDKVEVRWLDATNTVATFTDVRANYRVRLTEGDPTVVYVP